MYSEKGKGREGSEARGTSASERQSPGRQDFAANPLHYSTDGGKRRAEGQSPTRSGSLSLDRARSLSQGAFGKSHLEVSSSEPPQVEHASEERESARQRGKKRKSIEEGTSKTEHYEKHTEQEKKNDIKRPEMEEYKNFLVKSVKENTKVALQRMRDIELYKTRIEQIEIGNPLNAEDRASLLSQGASDKSHLEASSSEPHQVEHACF